MLPRRCRPVAPVGVIEAPRVQLNHGLFRTIEKPTSVPADQTWYQQHNPALAAERSRKREDLLPATEKELAAIKARVERKRNPLVAPPRSRLRSARCSTPTKW